MIRKHSANNIGWKNILTLYMYVLREIPTVMGSCNIAKNLMTRLKICVILDCCTFYLINVNSMLLQIYHLLSMDIFLLYKACVQYYCVNIFFGLLDVLYSHSNYWCCE